MRKNNSMYIDVKEQKVYEKLDSFIWLMSIVFLLSQCKYYIDTFHI